MHLRLFRRRGYHPILAMYSNRFGLRPWLLLPARRGADHGSWPNRPDLRLVVHRHVRDEHPGSASVHRRSGRELERHATSSPGTTSTASLKLGAVLEFGLIVTQIGTAVVLYPLVRRQSETIALGYVTARIMESVFAAIGLMSMLSVCR